MIFDTIQLGYTICKEGWGIDEKSPLFNRIYYIVNGDATLKHGEKSFKLTPSCLYILPYRQPYCITQNADNPLEVLWIHIHTTELALNDLHEIPIVPDSISEGFVKILIHFAQNAYLDAEFKQIFHAWIQFLSIEQDFAHKTHSDRYMEKISEFVDKHLNEGITVQDISEYLNIDRSHFSRKFKAMYQITPKAYLHFKRLHRASLLLLQGNSIAQTAEMTGYMDEKSFSRAFKQYMELSPAEYRRKYILQP